MCWHLFENSESIGQRGSENGIIIRDEEHDDGARITLERDGDVAPYAITCGIYGWMFHTRFFGTEAGAQREFQSMQAEIVKILASIPLTSDPHAEAKSLVATESISEFVRQFP